MPTKFVRFFLILLLLLFFLLPTIGLERSELILSCSHALTKLYTGENTCSVIKWKNNLNNVMATCTAIPSDWHKHTPIHTEWEGERESERVRVRDLNESDHNQSNWPFDFELKPHLQNVLSTVRCTKKKKTENNISRANELKNVRKKVVHKMAYRQGLIVSTINEFSLMIFSICSHKHRVHGAFKPFIWCVPVTMCNVWLNTHQPSANTN